jgi:hypothetical protein
MGTGNTSWSSGIAGLVPIHLPQPPELAVLQGGHAEPSLNAYGIFTCHLLSAYVTTANGWPMAVISCTYAWWAVQRPTLSYQRWATQKLLLWTTCAEPPQPCSAAMSAIPRTAVLIASPLALSAPGRQC